MPADLRPQGKTREVDFIARRLSLEITTAASRVAGVLDRQWAHDAAVATLEDRLVTIATQALELRAHLVKQRLAIGQANKEEADRG